MTRQELAFLGEGTNYSNPSASSTNKENRRNVPVTIPLTKSLNPAKIGLLDVLSILLKSLPVLKYPILILTYTNAITAATGVYHGTTKMTVTTAPRKDAMEVVQCWIIQGSI